MMQKKYYISPKIKRMVQKPASIINVLCNRYKTDPTEVFNVLNNLQNGNALVCIKKEQEYIEYAIIDFGTRYGAETFTVETITNKSPIYNVFYYAFFYIHEAPAFIDLKERTLKKLRDML